MNALCPHCSEDQGCEVCMRPEGPGLLASPWFYAGGAASLAIWTLVFWAVLA